MEHTEMLLAAHINDYARDLRNKDWRAALQAADLPLESKESREVADQFKIDWHDANPTANYVPKAYRLVRDVALQLRDLEHD